MTPRLTSLSSSGVLRTLFLISWASVPANLVWDAFGAVPHLLYNLALGSIFGLFCFLHGKGFFGARPVTLLLGVSVVVSFCLEFLGVKTGFVYGEYHYGEVLGPKILGTVPWLIPVSWFAFMYTAVVVTETLIGPMEEEGSHRIRARVVRAALDTLGMTALDLVIDPVWVHRGTWVWTGLGSLRPEEIFYGIPARNYFGWMLTNAIVFGVFRLAGAAPALDGARVRDRAFRWPVFLYVAIFVVGTIEAWVLLRNPGLIAVSLLSLGMVSMLALVRSKRPF